MEALGNLIGDWGVSPVRLVVIALTLGVVYLLFRGSRSASSARPDCGCGGESCSDILKDRYEKGHIKREDYDRIKKELE